MYLAIGQVLRGSLAELVFEHLVEGGLGTEPGFQCQGKEGLMVFLFRSCLDKKGGDSKFIDEPFVVLAMIAIDQM